LEKRIKKKRKLSQPEKDQVITICDHLKNLKYAKALPNAFTEHGKKYPITRLVGVQKIAL